MGRSKMKLIFLDFDGVLNNEKTTVRMSDGFIGLDYENVNRLNEIVAATDGRIVFSTSWRLLYSEKELNHFLVLAGYKGLEAVGQTPRMFSRDHDIRQCLKENIGKWRKYTILDDDGAIANDKTLLSKWVATNPKFGLTKLDVYKAVGILNG